MAAVNEPLDDQEFISRFSCHGYHFDREVPVARLPTPLVFIPPDRSLSGDTFNKLPLELAWDIFQWLDLQSLSRVSRVCSRAHALVRSFTAYREVLDTAPSAVAALQRTNLISRHSAIHIRSVLRSDRCEFCSEFGAYLFLPTCKRCCWQCLRVNPLLGVITPADAELFFRFEKHHIEELKIRIGHPGSNSNLPSKDSWVPDTLVSVSAARELGIQLHGSVENVAKNLRTRWNTPREIVIARSIIGATKAAEHTNPIAVPGHNNVLANAYFGVTAILFPSLQASGAVESGLWCRGCRQAYEFHRFGLFTEDTLEPVIPPEHGPEVLQIIAAKGRSKAEFLDHVKDCYGVQKLPLDTNPWNFSSSQEPVWDERQRNNCCSYPYLR